MKAKNITKVFLTLVSLFLVCTSSAFAEDQGQNQTGIVDTVKNDLNKVQFYGEVLLSGISYKINHLSDANADGNVTTQDDLDFLNDSQARFPFSEKPVFISMNSACEQVYKYVPEGVTEATVTDNSGNDLDSYTITKNETGFTIQKGASSNPDNSYAITLNELEKLDEIYGDVGQVTTCEMYIKDQIQTQA